LGDDDAWRRFLDVFGRTSLAAAVRQVYEVEDLAALERLWLEGQ
jgi:hypothetical protein